MDPTEKPRRRRSGWLALGVAVAAAAFLSALALGSHGSAPQGDPLASNPEIDPGTVLSNRTAPGFTLLNQFGRPTSLSSFRGKAVVLAFNDAECLGVCPLTTAEMEDAKRLLGPAGDQVQLLGVDANPTATSVADVRSYSQLHDLTHDWYFLTGSLAQLKRVWGAYGIEAQVVHGQIDHTPAVYVIDGKGRLAKVYLTPMAYAGRNQQAQIMAEELASILPGHPPVDSALTYQRIHPLAADASVALPRQGGGSVALGRGGTPHLMVFFATWDQEVMNIGAELDGLNSYAALAREEGLPQPVAVDEATVEPDAGALPRFLGSLAKPLDYPVALDTSGRLADLYGIEEEPWLVLTAPSGRTLWYYDAAASGWLAPTALAKQVRAALRKVGTPVPTPSAAAALAGSPPALAALHAQADTVLPGGQSALTARLESLHGHPVVLNAWASWCTPCQQEYPLFAAAGLRYGRQTAFLGADTEDSTAGARAFMDSHPLSYPSYETSQASLGSLAPIDGLPATIFIDASGKVDHLHFGPYDSQGSLDQDIETYATG